MFFQLIKDKVTQIYSCRSSLWNMSAKQLKARYAGSTLGIYWAVINPLLMMLAITFVFSVIFKTEISDFGLFVLAGIMAWMFFSGALSEATASYLTQKSVLHQFRLPKEILPLSCVSSYFMNFLISWGIIYPIFLLYNPRIFFTLPLLLFVILLTYLFTCGLGLLFGLVNIFFRDLEHLIGLIMMFWFWVTPVFYSIEMVPKMFRWIFNFNPMTAFILCYRDLLFTGKIPDAAVFLQVIIWTVLSLLTGLLVSVKFEASSLKRI